MRVKVLFFGVLKDITGQAEQITEIESGTTLGALFESYFHRYETLKDRTLVDSICEEQGVRIGGHGACQTAMRWRFCRL